MNMSFQELLFQIPMHQLTFFFSLPKRLLHYESVTFSLPEVQLSKPTLLIIQNNDELMKINNVDTANRIIQDLNLKGIVFSNEDHKLISKDILNLFQQCELPVIHINNTKMPEIFFQENTASYSYGRVSMELYGFMERGFVDIASQLALALDTPLLYLDENNQLLWQTGEDEKLRECLRWVNTNREKLEQGDPLISPPVTENEHLKNSFDIYSINIAGQFNQKLIVSANLVDWQKKMIDKLTGLTALFLQTEGMFQEQQQQFKEHFIYDLLYHKFDSKNIMVKQAKTWGWNLAKPHHLLVIDVTLPKSADETWLTSITIHFENKWTEENKPYIVFPFQDQIIVLVEDEENRSPNAKKSYILNIAEKIVEEFSLVFPDFQIQIGIGQWYQDTLFLNKSYQEAKLALKFGHIWLEERHIFHIKDLGVIRLLTHIHQEILGDYYQDYLSQLIESDKENGTEYIKTLKALIQHKGITSEISKALFIHPNTLRNRIKKIEELTGIDLQDPQEFVNLIVAVKIHFLLSM